MGIRQYLIIAFLVPAVFCFFSATALGQGKIRVGSMRVLPEISYELENNDNIFLEDNNEQDDYIHTLSPSLSLDWRKDTKNSVRLGYQADIVRYDSYSQIDYETHQADFEFEYASPTGFYARGWDMFVDTSDPYGSLNEYKRGVPQTDRWHNTAVAIFGYDFPNKVSAELHYRNYVQDYDRFIDHWQNYTVHEPGVKIFYRFLPKTSALFEYRWETRSYDDQQKAMDNSYGADRDNSQDFDYHRFFIGLSFDPSAKVNGEMKIGWGRRDFENDFSFRTDASGNPLAYDDSSTWIAETFLYYQMLARTKWSFSLMRADMDSADVDTTAYTRTRVGIGLEQGVTSRLKFFGNLYYEQDDYEQDREDEEYGAGLRLQLAVKQWCFLNASYLYLEEDSNIEGKSFSNNRFGVSAQLRF
jgi:hypothetical protein